MSSDGMISLWNKCDLYREGFQVPVGFTNSALTKFIEHNTAMFRNIQNNDEDAPSDMVIDDQNQIYFVDNKIGNIFNEMLGEYTDVKRVTQIIHDSNPRNNGLENALSKIFEKIEKRKQLWEVTRMPCIEGMLLYGTSWSRFAYNSRRYYPHGDIQTKVIHPKDVLIGKTREKYYADSPYRIYKQYVELEAARRYLFDNFGIDPNEVSADSDDTLPDTRVIDNNDMHLGVKQIVTFYHVEWRETYMDLNVVDVPDGDGIKQTIREERDYYFYAIYTKSVGIPHFEINKNTYSNQDYDKFTVTPYVDVHSNTRTWALSTIEQLINIQDFINITKSLLLDNARQRNIIRAVVKQRITDKYGDLWDRFLRFGDPLPLDEDIDINRAIKFVEIPGLPKEVYDFLSVAENSLASQAVTRDVLRGEYPSSDLSGTAIKQIRQEARRRMNYKDVNITWATTQEAYKLYNIVANEFTEEDFVNMTKQKDSNSGVIIYNAVKLLPDYLKFLAVNGIDQKKFEAHNEVEIVQNATKSLDSFDPVVANSAAIEAQKYLEVNPEIPPDLKGNPEAVKAMANIFARMRTTLVFINKLSPKDEMVINVELDFDEQRRKDTDRQTAIWLFGQGKYPFEMLLEDLGGQFAVNSDRIIELQRQYDLALQLQQQIEQRGPEFVNAVGKLMAMFDATRGQQMQKGGNPAKGRTETPAAELPQTREQV